MSVSWIASVIAFAQKFLKVFQYDVSNLIHQFFITLCFISQFAIYFSVNRHCSVLIFFHNICHSLLLLRPRYVIHNNNAAGICFLSFRPFVPLHQFTPGGHSGIKRSLKAELVFDFSTENGGIKSLHLCGACYAGIFNLFLAFCDFCTAPAEDAKR